MSPEPACAASAAAPKTGDGPSCPGQVLVIFDALGVTAGRSPHFVRSFMVSHDIEAALAAFMAAVKDRSFAGPEHCF